jgi:hypothetical protein
MGSLAKQVIPFLPEELMVKEQKFNASIKTIND